MPLGALFGILFYLLVVFAAISSSISLLEVIVAHFCDKARDAGKGDKRKVYSSSLPYSLAWGASSSAWILWAAPASLLQHSGHRKGCQRQSAHMV